MTYSQTFKGSLRFANAHRLEAGLDALAGYHDDREENAVMVGDLRINGLEVRVDYDNMLPASMSFGTCSALRRLANHALSGAIRATYEGESSDTMVAGGRRDESDLPPRHHRWEVYAAARAGSAKALRALRKQNVDIVVDFDSMFGKESSLDLAAEAGSPDAVREILDAGAKATPAALGAAKNRATAEVLLRSGAKPTAATLVDACDNHRADVAFALLRAGAKLPTKKEDLVALLRAVARSGNLELLKALARDPAARRALEGPRVIEAAINEKKKAVEKWLLQQGATIPEEPASIEDVANAWNASKYEEALTLLRKVDDSNENTFGLEGISNGYLGRYARASAALRKSVEHDPDNAMWRNGLAYFLACAGKKREAATQYRKALAQVESDLKDEPEDASLWSRKAYALNGLGRSKEALAAAKRSNALDPKEGLALVNEGRALLAMNRPKDARKILERAVKLDPLLAEPRFHLAIARARCGDEKGAKKMLAKLTVSPHLVALAKKDSTLAPLMKK